MNTEYGYSLFWILTKLQKASCLLGTTANDLSDIYEITITFSFLPGDDLSWKRNEL